MPGTAIVLLTRDLRVHDNPALHAAVTAAERVVPLFVADPAVPSSPNRDHFMAGCLADLRDALRRRGADLVVRRGDPVAETVALATALGATHVALAADASAYAARRQRRLAEAAVTHRFALHLADGVTVVPPGAVTPAGGGHYRVFTPYWRVWRAHPRRPVRPAPARLRLPDGVDPGPLPDPGRPTRHDGLAAGETAGRRRLAAWRRQVADYPAHRDDLAADATSRLSPYLHFGCVAAAAVESTCDGVEEFHRQLCWRDFHHQVLADFPDLPRLPYRPGPPPGHAHPDAAARPHPDGRAARTDPDGLAAWRAGRTGVPVVDAGMRQLAAEGWLPNRARLVTAAFLTRTLGLDWRDGVDWYARHLIDADVASNSGNWQWVAGTGNDTRPNRRFNPLRQAERFDPEGDWVRRWVPELAGVPGRAVHRPWLLPGRVRYDAPLAGVTREG
jgi:deoxyribodipyrimidine photo-lyase